jgi:uncharacterized membrane protein
MGAALVGFFSVVVVIVLIAIGLKTYADPGKGWVY